MIVVLASQDFSSFVSVFLWFPFSPLQQNGVCVCVCVCVRMLAQYVPVQS